MQPTIGSILKQQRQSQKLSQVQPTFDQLNDNPDHHRPTTTVNRSFNKDNTPFGGSCLEMIVA
ncbi:hypothetical protein ME793_19170 [Lactobacillus delbrueckii]|nr:hypothetical protein ME793_19170 [Lactobacillus delbrueckii]GHN40635.1 hypothetical protein ME795_19170 [Lactobacillus delbrueckii]GHN55952.1 hypothetical protein ME803_19010 [Lactobacillus delbrueckii]GHN59690.1 hypothetical protein ME805_19140 [Lactobacillus delbrueckii]